MFCPDSMHQHAIGLNITVRPGAGASTAFLALFSLLVFCGPSGMAPFNGSSTGSAPYAALPAGDGALARHGRVLTSFEPTDTDHDAAVALVQGQPLVVTTIGSIYNLMVPLPRLFRRRVPLPK